MNEELTKNADDFYRLAEQKAAHYFKSLYIKVMEKGYVATLEKDIESWKGSHVRHHSLFSLFKSRKGKPDSREYYSYIKWLDYTGKLENYLDRSISYIFMRDLGKTLDSHDTQLRIKRTVDKLKNHLTSSMKSNQKDENDSISMYGLYKMAKKENIEPTMIWLINKLKNVSINIPKGMDAEHAQRKLIKIIAGVVMHQIEEMDNEISPKERMDKLDKAIRLGYSYGLTYPFIDDLLDAKVLTDEEEKRYSDLIRTTLITGSVPELGNWSGGNKELIEYVHVELKGAFEYIKNNQRADTIKSFLNQAYVFFNSQEIDRGKNLSNEKYTNEEVYIPIILKSASSRLITRLVISAPEDEEFDNLIFYYGIYNQLADDFADMFDDMNEGAVTPYTYYMKYHEKREDIINPYELYWTVIANLIHNVYDSDKKTCEVILDRAINGLKRFKERMGTEKYNEIMKIFAARNSKFSNLIENMVKKADDVDFFDKLLRDHIIAMLRNERKEQEEFLDTIETLRVEINSILSIPENEKISTMQDTIVDAANFALEGDGKRIRPIMTLVIGVNEYGLNKDSILPLIKSIEYMHTASLIFDDLPSQDNASTRRGRPTLHEVYNVAVAELTGLFLTQKAIQQQASLNDIDSKSVLNMIKYSAKMTADMCKGQVIDLESKGKNLTIEELNMMCFYKTGKAFEASLIMPAILANAEKKEIEALKKFAYYAGIAFQIKDDILDVEGDQKLLGKSTGKDAENNNSNFVSVLGVEGAKIEMWEHYCTAIDSLKDVPRNTTFLKHLLNHIINRDY